MKHYVISSFIILVIYLLQFLLWIYSNDNNFFFGARSNSYFIYLCFIPICNSYFFYDNNHL